jgi:hypothetical protein
MPDACRAAAHQREFAFEFQIHFALLTAFGHDVTRCTIID